MKCNYFDYNTEGRKAVVETTRILIREESKTDGGYESNDPLWALLELAQYTKSTALTYQTSLPTNSGAV